jgi:hypothetical protein
MDVWPGNSGFRCACALKEMVVMMFGYGSNSALWEVGLMWVGTVACWLRKPEPRLLSPQRQGCPPGVI